MSQAPEIAVVSRHAPPQGFLRRWVFSTDHKVIGIQYLALALVAAFTGIALSLLLRLRLNNPMEPREWLEGLFPVGAPGGLMTPEFYLAVLTMHGTLMVFFVLTTAPQGGFGNFILPLQIGAEDMAFPRLNMLSFWLTFASFLVLMTAFFVEGGAPITGWTAYPPLSALEGAAIAGWGQDLWIVSIGIFCIASLLSAINFIVTTLELRARGMTMLRLPLTVWGWFFTAVVSLLAFGVLLAGAILLLLDRRLDTSFYVPAGLVINDQIINREGGSPILWQHLFWFFGHPEVYIAILPGMGIISTVLANFSRKPVFGYRAMILAGAAIVGLGFLIWGHHMFVSGMSPYSAFVFSLLTMAIGVPSAIKTFNWIGTMWGGRLRFASPMLYAIGFVSIFVSGGLTGLFLGQPALDMVFHDTYFVVAHFHLIMGVAAIFAMFAGLAYWHPKIFGRHMNETLGKIHFWGTFLGVYAIFGPMHFLGMIGHPRRYAEATALDYLTAGGAPALHEFITIAAMMTIGFQLLFAVNLVWSLWRGRRATPNPWEATTLEWATASPPVYDNFGGRLPEVRRGPYEYSLPGATRDFVMQNEPDAAPAPAGD